MDNDDIISKIRELLEQDQRETRAMRSAAEALPRQQTDRPERVDLSRIEQSLARMEAALQKMAAVAAKPQAVR